MKGQHLQDIGKIKAYFYQIDIDKYQKSLTEFKEPFKQYWNSNHNKETLENEWEEKKRIEDKKKCFKLGSKQNQQERFIE